MEREENLLALSAIELRDRLQAGALSAVELATACLARIDAREADVRAWTWLDRDAVLRDAQRLDDLRSSVASIGPLHGLPIGVKDVIDTAGIPTENGCPVDAGRVPDLDATCVARFKAAGAILFGKTVTTELAFMHPGKSRNPRNLEHTPGGSSSGSAAAVADRMVPLAIGTQTGGSVIRPASFCGVTGFKPTFNAISRDGVLLQSHSLDTVGVFAQDPQSVALLASVLMGCSTKDLVPTTNTKRRSPPRLAFVQPPGWEKAAPELRDALSKLVAELGDIITPWTLPAAFHEAAHQRDVINTAEMGHYFRRYLDEGAQNLGPPTRETITRGVTLPAPDYIVAKTYQSTLEAALAPLFASCDAVICPAAPGPAPSGLTSTGDSIFNGLWTMAGTPAITLPLLTAPNNLPMGVQLVGAVGADADLISIAQWVWEWASETPLNG